jgi:hypothetical protein
MAPNNNFRNILTPYQVELENIGHPLRAKSTQSSLHMPRRGLNIPSIQVNEVNSSGSLNGTISIPSSRFTPILPQKGAGEGGRETCLCSGSFS